MRKPAYRAFVLSTAAAVAASGAYCGDNIGPATTTDGSIPASDAAPHDARPLDAALDALVAAIDAPAIDAHQNDACPTPLPPAAIDHTLVVQVPSDFDATANPTTTTTIAFTTLLPARCPGDAFPLILHSHGCGGSRITALGSDGTLHGSDAMFASIDELAAALPYHGYVVLSFDERGHGASKDANARIIDPNAETKDARALLDWAYDNAADLAVQREDTTGIAKDVKVGTLGYSYGGGFQLPLAIVDARIDTIVPTATWHELLYSLLPGDSVKLSFDGLLCLLATTGGVKNTPLVQTLCNTVGVTGLAAQSDRSRADLATAVDQPTAQPRPVTETELTTFLDDHSVAFFQRSATPPAHPVPALFIQGNRDNLFNLTEELWNARYFAMTGADVRTISTEGGHMNPLASQVEGTANCGGTQGVTAILAWFDKQLKGKDSAAFTAIPHTCVSVANTGSADTAPAAGLVTSAPLVGAQTGSGAIAATLAAGSASLPLGTQQVFVPVVTIGATIHTAVLAGVPTVGKVTVTAGIGALQSTNAFIGVGIQRGGTVFLVDDQVTAFEAGVHTNNRNVAEDANIWLPAVGEQLQAGDVVGLVAMSQHVQYAAVVSAASAPGAPGVVNFIGGTSIPPITSGLSPISGLTYLNPYTVTFSDIELPIVIPGAFPGASLSTPQP